MKKVLLTTTALLVSAGIASADDLSTGVHIKGSAEIGVVGGDPLETQFWTDLDVDFDMSTTTDNGLTFGASIDLDELANGISATGTPRDSLIPPDDGKVTTPVAVYVKGGFGKLTIGDTDGAFDFAMKEAIIGGTINDVQEHAGYSGNSGLDGAYDGQVARYDNTFGGLSFAVSVEIDDRSDAAVVATGVPRGDAILGVGVKYAMGNFGFGVGYQSANGVDIAGVSVDASFGSGFEAIANYSELSGGGVTVTHTGIALGYTMNDLTLAMNWGQFDTPVGDLSGWGAIVNYDLGGGAVLKAGYGSSDVAGVDISVYSVGLGISF